MRRQHANMYAFGEKGTRFSVDAMRKDAARRLERDGWTSTIHMHDKTQPCNNDCEDYFPEESVKTENLPDPVPPRIEDHTVASDPDYETIPWGAHE